MIQLLDGIRWVIDGGNITMKEKLREILQIAKGKSFLDIGCGTGTWCNLLPWDYTGIDLDKSSVDYARSKYGKTFHHMNAAKLNFEDKSFDVSLMMDMIHHLDDETAKKALAEACRVTKETVVIIDSVQSINPIQRAIMSFDFGKHIRKPGDLTKLIGVEPKEFFNSGLYYEVAYVLNCRQP